MIIRPAGGKRSRLGKRLDGLADALDGLLNATPRATEIKPHVVWIAKITPRRHPDPGIFEEFHRILERERGHVDPGQVGCLYRAQPQPGYIIDCVDQLIPVGGKVFTLLSIPFITEFIRRLGCRQPHQVHVRNDIRVDLHTAA